MTKIKFYSLKKILSKNAQYNMIFGERSNGKTFACLEYAIKDYFANDNELAIVRRWREDFKGKRGQMYFNNLVENGIVAKYSKGIYDKVVYKASKWYFARFDEKLNKDILSLAPFAFAFALSETEHDKSASFPKIKTIIFDEFLTRSFYLPDEFILFMNTLSTIIRYRDDVKIFMLGNTVNKFCPYFAEMGLNHVLNMAQGTIDVYSYGDSNLKVAVEYSSSLVSKKPSDLYFAFDNPKLNMIKTGAWELAIYPHLPFKYKPADILFTYFIIFESNILQCEIIYKNDSLITYIHAKTTPIKNPDNDLIYTLEYNPRPNYAINVLKPVNDIQRKVAKLFVENKVFYQNNEIGEIVRNYLMTAQKLSIFN